jgi:uncharacterized protein
MLPAFVPAFPLADFESYIYDRNMRESFFATMILVLCGGVALQSFAAEPASPSATAPIETNSAWRIAVYDFSRNRLQHSAWGLAHAERNFLMAQRLAGVEGLSLDEDIIFAAAFLHDVAAFEEFGKVGVDHTEHGAEVAAKFLGETGFPKDKIPAVQDAIREHMFYSRAGERAEAIVLHDADTLDFLGYVGIARIISLTTRHRWASDLRGAIATIDKFSKELPAKLITKAAKKVAEERVQEMKSFLDSLDEQTHGGKSL